MDDSQILPFLFSLKLVTVHSDGYFVLAPIIIKVILKSLKTSQAYSLSEPKSHHSCYVRLYYCSNVYHVHCLSQC